MRKNVVLERCVASPPDEFPRLLKFSVYGSYSYPPSRILTWLQSLNSKRSEPALGAARGML